MRDHADNLDRFTCYRIGWQHGAGAQSMDPKYTMHEKFGAEYGDRVR